MNGPKSVPLNIWYRSRGGPGRPGCPGGLYANSLSPSLSLLSLFLSPSFLQSFVCRGRLSIDRPIPQHSPASRNPLAITLVRHALFPLYIISSLLSQSLFISPSFHSPTFLQSFPFSGTTPKPFLAARSKPQTGWEKFASRLTHMPATSKCQPLSLRKNLKANLDSISILLRTWNCLWYIPSFLVYV